MENNFLKINLCKMYLDFLPRKCGYCKLPNCVMYGLSLDYIPIDIYEEMYFKGWTRCGDFFYKTTYERTCCKLYQPRVNINDFKISKEQKKVMKRFRKYLSGEYEENKLKQKENKIKDKNEDKYKFEISQKIKDYINSKLYLKILKKYMKEVNEDQLELFFNKIKESKVRRITNKNYNSDYSYDFIFIIKNILISKKKEKNEINITDDIKNILKELYNNFIEFYQPINEDIFFCEETGHINFKIKNQEEYKNYVKSNKTILKEKKEKKIEIENKSNPTEKYKLDYFSELIEEPEINLPLKHHYSFEITDKVSVSGENDEKFILYKKYQKAIHKEEVTPNVYNKNWGKTILQKDKIILKPNDLNSKVKHPEIYPNYYGTYNFIHRIDGKIIAVTVNDILPNSLLSVYCYYDPDYSFLNLGVFTAIREIEYMKSFKQLINNNLTYYSMEEICPTCQKSKYKVNFKPFEIMDHYTGKYVYLNDNLKQLIEDGKCHHLIENVENPEYEFFNDIEKDNIYWNLLIEVKSLGDFQYLDDFCHLYLDEINKKTIMKSFRRFLDIIDKKSFDKCRFYYEETLNFL